MYFQEKEGYGKYVPCGTPNDPFARLCSRCCRKEYIVRRNLETKYLRRDPSESDIREFKLNKLLNKKK